MNEIFKGMDNAAEKINDNFEKVVGGTEDIGNKLGSIEYIGAETVNFEFPSVTYGFYLVIGTNPSPGNTYIGFVHAESKIISDIYKGVQTEVVIENGIIKCRNIAGYSTGWRAYKI